MEAKKGIIILSAKGHKNIKASHKSTIELTTNSYLTKRGNCIIGIESSLSASMIPNIIKEYMKNRDAHIEIILESGGYREVIKASGHTKLKLTSKHAMVIRRSAYIDGRTIAIKADKAAIDIDRKLVDFLRRGGKLKVIICVK